MKKYLGSVVFLLGTAVAVFLLGLFMASCATIPHDPLYDGEERIIGLPDSTTLIRLTIQNNRTRDALDPHFYLSGTGRHSLGVVAGMGTKKVLFVNTKWLGPDGCVTITAHYVGLGDWTSAKACYHAGYVFDVSLQEIFATSTAWAHPA